MKSRLLALALLVFAALAIAVPVYWSNKLKSDWNAWEAPPPSPDAQSKLAKLAQAGDSFGPFNTLFASLAFATALFAIWRQHKETLEAESLRRADATQRTKDKEQEDERHGELLAAQEHIAKVNGYTSLIQAHSDRMKREGEKLVHIDRLMTCLMMIDRCQKGGDLSSVSKNLVEVLGDMSGHLHSHMDQLRQLCENAQQAAKRVWETCSMHFAPHEVQQRNAASEKALRDLLLFVTELQQEARSAKAKSERLCSSYCEGLEGLLPASSSPDHN